MAALLKAALALTDKGQPVFPCGTDKRPLTPHGFKDAETDANRVRGLWDEHGGSGVGIATGAASGFPGAFPAPFAVLLTAFTFR